MRYKDEALLPHPHIGERNVFHMAEFVRRGEIANTLCPSLEFAEHYAADLAKKHPDESIIVLEQRSVFELPSLPDPVKKKFNSKGDLVPDAAN